MVFLEEELSEAADLFCKVDDEAVDTAVAVLPRSLLDADSVTGTVVDGSVTSLVDS